MVGAIIIDISINLTVYLNMNRFNHKHCLVGYYLQLLCGEILTVIYCFNEQIIEVMAINGAMH